MQVQLQGKHDVLVFFIGLQYFWYKMEEHSSTMEIEDENLVNLDRFYVLKEAKLKKLRLQRFLI